ncbi:unnamed protein product [Amaranthus hypochondriacus]
MSYISPTKIIIFFNDDASLREALDVSSPLWDICSDVKQWVNTSGQQVERLIWLECVGLNPCIWSYDCFRRIGELWGSIVRVNHEYNGIISLTSSKILIRTTTLNRIESCVKLEWTSGSCEVWVKELKEVGRMDCVPNVEDEHTNKSVHSLFDIREERAFIRSTGNGKLIEKNTHHIDGENVGNCNMVPCCVHGKEGDNLENYNDLDSIEQRSGVPPVPGNSKGVGNVLEDGVFQDNADSSRKACDGFLTFEAVEDVPTEDPNLGLDNVTLNDNGLDKEVQVVVDDSQNVKEKLNQVEENNGEIILEDQQQIIMRDNFLQTNVFDPISSVEYPLSCQSNGCNIVNGGSKLYSMALMSSNSLTQKRPRGRPKRIVHSLPEPLRVLSTPSKSNSEAIETWNTAKHLGVKSTNEAAVISQLRKSKRLLLMEENSPKG